MSIKKCVNGSFVNDFYKEYGTDTDTITSLPKTIIGDGQPISAYTIKGNMSQSGTPTPSNPVYPVETGDKTANLFDMQNAVSGYIKTDGSIATSVLNKTTDYLSVESNADYTLSLISSSTTGNILIGFYDSTQTFISRWASTNLAEGYNTITRTTPNNTAFMRITWYFQDCSNIMLNSGSTALPYEPYGMYKIPISFGQGNYTFYLSEPIRAMGTYVDTALSTGTANRAIGTVEFDGSENWSQRESPSNSFFIGNIALTTVGYCNLLRRVSAAASLVNDTIYVGTTAISVKIENVTTTQELQAWLAQKKAEGTPLKVWYVLATATTETFTAPTIPTSGSPQSFDVDTTLKPSEVSLTWHGWHEHSDTKYTSG